jgi:hypothetical protein
VNENMNSTAQASLPASDGSTIGRNFSAEVKAAGFVRNFIGIEDQNELKAALLAADENNEQWPAPGWLRLASPIAMRGVRAGWATWRGPAPDGAIELQSEHEQRVACGNRWFLFSSNGPDQGRRASDSQTL